MIPLQCPKPQSPGDSTVRGAHASTVDWRTLLRRYMTDAAKYDYSRSLPNRRFIDSYQLAFY